MFSTHRMDQVEKLCDSICLVDHGKAVLEGHDARGQVALRSQPRHHRVRQATHRFSPIHQSPNCANIPAAPRFKLRDGADGQALLHSAARHAQIFRFELVEPSLEEIFIRTVGGKVDA